MSRPLGAQEGTTEYCLVPSLQNVEAETRQRQVAALTAAEMGVAEGGTTTKLSDIGLFQRLSEKRRQVRTLTLPNALRWFALSDKSSPSSKLFSNLVPK